MENQDLNIQLLILYYLINSLSNGKNLHKLKTFQYTTNDDICGKIENIVRKGENACNQHFLLFPKYFQSPSLLDLLTQDSLVNSLPFTTKSCILMTPRQKAL